jgi:hypothetical protein
MDGLLFRVPWSFLSPPLRQTPCFSYLLYCFIQRATDVRILPFVSTAETANVVIV